MAGLLGMLGASARNLGQAGKNYGRIARDRGADLLKSHPEYAIGAGAAGVVGGSILTAPIRKKQYDDHQELTDHINIWKEYTDLPLESKAFQKFLYAKPNVKSSLIRSAAKLSQDVSQDVDDALYKTDAWERITKPKGKDPFGFGTER